jgi:Domain of unknown function (DUF4332)
VKGFAQIAAGIAASIAVLSGALCTSVAQGLEPPISNPCTAGDALLEQHLLNDALVFYRAELHADPGLACAKLGRVAIAGERAYVRRKLAEGDQAREAANELRSRAATARPGAAAVALRKRASAKDDLANAAYADAVAHDGGPATAALAPAGPPDNWFVRTGDWVESQGQQLKTVVIDRADDAGYIVAAIAAVLLAITVLVMLVLRFLLLSRRFGRWVHRIPGLGRVTHRALVVGELKGEKIDLAWQLRDALGEASAPLGQGVDLATGTDNADAVLGGVNGALADLPQGKLLQGAWQLLRLLVSVAPLRVAGTIIPRESRGYAVSLTVARGRHLIATETLWQESYEVGPVDAGAEATDPPWQRLAIAGAAWAQYVWLDRLGGTPLTQALGTADWQSFAFLQVGRDVMANEADRELAQTLFARAVDRDPGNREAAFNLAVMERRRDDPGQAIERLSQLVRNLGGPTVAYDVGTLSEVGEEAGRLPHERALLWFQATYNLSAAYLQRYLRDYRPGDTVAVDRERRGDFSMAMGCARLLVCDIEVVLESLPSSRGRRYRGAKPARESDLVAIEGPAIVLLAGLRTILCQGRGTTGLAQPEDAGKVERNDVRDSARSAQQIGTDVGPDDLVERFVLRDPHRSAYRTRYNLACYYSRLAAMKARGRPADDPDVKALFDRALVQLAYALETRDLIELASGDVFLRELRNARPAEFWNALGRQAPADQAGVLGKLRAIGPSFAAKLATADVDTVAKLADRTIDPVARAALAGDVGASLELVERWGVLALLITAVDSLGIDGANLLDELRIDSVQALADFDESRLTCLLGVIDEATAIVATAPTSTEVHVWISQAKGAMAT